MADENPAGAPATEKRGGEKPDWARAKPGRELPELPDVMPEREPGPDPG